MLVGLGAIVAASAARASSAALAIASHEARGINVDGNGTDWSGIPTIYLENGPRLTAIANDDHDLYIHVQFADIAVARAIVTRGLTVWVSADGRHETAFGVRYRGPAEIRDAVEGIARDDGLGSGPPQREREDPRQGSPRIPPGAVQVLRDGVPDDVVPAGSGPGSPAGAAAVVGDAYSYEMRIPLKAAGVPAPAAGTETPTTIAVGFQVGGFSKEERAAMRERRNEGMEGEGGIRPGGGGAGMRPGMGGFGRGGFAEGHGTGRGGRTGGPPDAPVVWLDVTLTPLTPRGGK